MIFGVGVREHVTLTIRASHLHARENHEQRSGRLFSWKLESGFGPARVKKFVVIVSRRVFQGKSP